MEIAGCSSHIAHMGNSLFSCQATRCFQKKQNISGFYMVMVYTMAAVHIVGSIRREHDNVETFSPSYGKIFPP